MSIRNHCIIPDWPAPPSVRALQTTRHGGVSAAPYDTLNLGGHVGDAPLNVARNRMLLSPLLPSEPVWLEQVHGTIVANADMAGCRIQADACIARHRDSVCVVMTADCLPILLCDKQGTVVGAAHAGWKGLAAGVIETTVQAMNVAPRDLMAWLGPAISQDAFEVGEEVRDIFVAAQPQALSAFTPSLLTPLPEPSPQSSDRTPSQSTKPAGGQVAGYPASGRGGERERHSSILAGEGRGEGEKFLADIYSLARMRLNALGITQIFGGDFCTFHERDRFFSYRRDGVTGRMGTFIWLA